MNTDSHHSLSVVHNKPGSRRGSFTNSTRDDEQKPSILKNRGANHLAPSTKLDPSSKKKSASFAELDEISHSNMVNVLKIINNMVLMIFLLSNRLLISVLMIQRALILVFLKKWQVARFTKPKI
jgi:hypothetical protein